MEEAEKNLVIAAAREAGIPKIYQSIINPRNELDAKPIC